MSERRAQRRLSAVLAADVAGYSRLMQLDEESTMRAWWEYRREIVDPNVTDHGGRIVKLTGDGFLAEFSSAIDAVEAAVAMQRAIAPRLTGIAQDRRVQFRMGINLGDILWDDEDIYGDGVNIAARIETLADAGGLSVSAGVYEQVHRRLQLHYEDLGEKRLKNIDTPVRIYRVLIGDAAASLNEFQGGLALPAKPSIAVLPFDNMSSDVEQGYFGDGLAEDVITTLSKVSSLFVIARHSSFAYKGKPTDVRRIAADLGVRYVLEGSVRGSGARIRVTAQLIDCEDGRQLWAERYDRKLEDIFDIQDEITREIVTALRIQLSDGEQAQLFLKGTQSVAAWSLAFGALDRIMSGTPAPITEARQLLQQAVALDAQFAPAHALIALSHYFEVHFGFTADAERSLQLLKQASERALAIEPNSPLGHCSLGIHALYVGNDDEALFYGTRAVELSPNDAFLKLGLARILIPLGHLAEAEAQVRAAIRINPFFPIYYFGVLANALEMQGKCEEAIQLLRTALARDNNYFAGHLRLASLLGLAGNLDEARSHAEQALRISPRIGSALLKGFYMTNNPAALARFVKGLCAAGIQID